MKWLGFAALKGQPQKDLDNGIKQSRLQGHFLNSIIMRY
jgi:hypothetical protein